MRENERLISQVIDQPGLANPLGREREQLFRDGIRALRLLVERQYQVKLPLIQLFNKIRSQPHNPGHANVWQLSFGAFHQLRKQRVDSRFNQANPYNANNASKGHGLRYPGSRWCRCSNRS
ncbi:hypothetical protein D3C79_869110 [compost metagenome]